MCVTKTREVMGKETGPDRPWEPVFDDPVFLEKLEAFLKAFARRYDGQPWLRYLDIGFKRVCINNREKQEVKFIVPYDAFSYINSNGKEVQH